MCYNMLPELSQQPNIFHLESHQRLVDSMGQTDSSEMNKEETPYLERFSDDCLLYGLLVLPEGIQPWTQTGHNNVRQGPAKT